MFYLHGIEDNIMKDLSYYSGHVSQLQNIFPIYEYMFFVDINVDIMELDSDQVCHLFLQRVRPYWKGHSIPLYHTILLYLSSVKFFFLNKAFLHFFW